MAKDRKDSVWRLKVALADIYLRIYGRSFSTWILCSLKVVDKAEVEFTKVIAARFRNKKATIVQQKFRQRRDHIQRTERKTQDRGR